MTRVPRRVLVLTLATLVVAGAACTSGDTPPRGSTGSTSAGTTAEIAVTGPTGETGSAEPERESLLPKDQDFVAEPRDKLVPMWEEPGKGRQPDFAFQARNDFDEPTPMLIEHATMRDGEAWYQVLLPLRPNGESAWVRAGDVRVREREDRLEIDLSEHLLLHYRADEVVDRFKVGIGTEQYPTTTGTFYVYIKVPYEDPNQPYGIMALGLSGFSRVITDWPGGGRIAVHGTPYASDRGDAVSHGCVRVFNDDMEHLTDLPLGTPVEIHD